MTTAEKLIKVTKNRQKLYDKGKQDAYDNFWDAAQKNGTRTSYSYAFSGGCWTDKTFRPKYDIIAQPGNGIFQGNGVTDYVKLFSDCGVVFDTSKSNNNQYMFYGSFATRIPVIDLSADTTSVLAYVFNACRSLKSIEKVILKQDGSQKFTATFSGCTSLVEIRIEGVIGNTISFADSPLSRESMESIISALSDTSVGAEITFKRTAKENAFTDAEWEEIKLSKANWKFNLA